MNEFDISHFNNGVSYLVDNETYKLFVKKKPLLGRPKIADVLEPVLDRMYPPIGDGNLDVETIEKLTVFLKQLYDDSQQ